MRLVKFIFALFFTLVCINSMASEYAFIVDAGSSGSRVYIYKIDKTNSANLVNYADVAEVNKLKVEPGLSAVARAKSPRVIKNYLKPLINFAKANIPAKKQKSAKVYWYSTAGMRLVSPVHQKNIYSKIKKYIEKNSSFTVHAIDTIPGKIEGAYMWLGANYKVIKQGVNTTTGILDMGGASTQIVYSISKKSSRQPTVVIDMRNSKINLFSYSFLGLGRNEIRHQFSNEKVCFQKGYRLPNGNVATGNYNQCAKIVDQFLSSRYSVENKIQPIPKRNFIAYDGFYKARKAIKLYSKFSGKQLKKIGRKLCSTSWVIFLDQMLSTQVSILIVLTRLIFHHYFGNMVFKKIRKLKYPMAVGPWVLQCLLQILAG